MRQVISLFFAVSGLVALAMFMSFSTAKGGGQETLTVGFPDFWLVWIVTTTSQELDFNPLRWSALLGISSLVLFYFAIRLGKKTDGDSGTSTANRRRQLEASIQEARAKKNLTPEAVPQSVSDPIENKLSELPNSEEAMPSQHSDVKNSSDPETGEITQGIPAIRSSADANLSQDDK
jgi:hypothetical protein